MGFKSPIDMQPALQCTRKRSRCDQAMDVEMAELVPVVPRRKRVRFARPAESLDEADVVTKVHNSELTYDDLNKKSLWWSKGERTDLWGSSRKIARRFKKSNADHVNHYLFVFDQCSQAPSHSSSDYLESARLGVPTEVRGLECVFVPSIKAYRKQHVLEVLEAQNHLMGGRLPEEMRFRVLSTRAIRSSRPSRVMARLMGEGDTRNS